MQPEKPEPQNWYNAKMTLVSPKEIGVFEKWRIEHRGKVDVRRAQIGFSEDGIVHSSFCSQLLEKANKKIEKIWQQCHVDLSILKPFLDYKQEEFDHALFEYNKYLKEKDRIISQIRNTEMLGDSAVSEATLNERIKKRIYEGTLELNKLIDSKHELLDSITNDSKRSHHDYRTRKEIAVSNNNIISHDLKQKVSLYMQGAWRLIDAPQFEVFPPKTTEEPIKRFDNTFPDYCFSIKERTKQLGSV